LRRWRDLSVVAVTAAILALAVSGATASLASSGTAAAKLRVVIVDQGKDVAGRSAGKFVLQGAAGTDSGTTFWRGAHKQHVGVRDGQRFTETQGTYNLNGNKGKVTLSWAGVRVVPGGPYFVWFGSWNIIAGSGTGMYEGWRGGGRFAEVDRATATGDNYQLQWEGLLTR
jgi:hypothetical protein